MKQEIKNLLKIITIFLLIYIAFFNHVLEFITPIIVSYSPDSYVKEITIIKILVLTLIDFLILFSFLYLIIYQKIRIRIQYLLIATIAFIQFIIFQFIVLLDSKGCNSEYYSLKYLTIANLVGGAIFSLLIARKTKIDRLKFFWYVVFLGILYLLIGILALFNAVYYNQMYNIFWFCYHTAPPGRVELPVFPLGTSVVVEFITEMCTEEYLETFASLLYMSGFFLKYKEHKK